MPTTRPVAIVTGGSKGIGAEVCRRLARDGLAVIVNYSGEAGAADKLVSEIMSAGGSAKAVKADVGDPAAMARLFEVADAAFGPVTVLVNNAGIMKLSPVVEARDDLFDAHVNVNLKGTFNGMREAAKRMSEGGRIVSFSSSVVGLYQPTYVIYAATKAGIEAMPHILAKELKGRNITVNAVAPGPVGTDLFLKGKSDEEVQQAAKMNPLGRIGQPADIASVISFLVGPDGGWVNGQVLRANGGVV